jgi:hypothetical protein
VNIPAAPGVYALLNKKRRFAYVAFSGNLQKRSHSLSHMLLQNDATSGPLRQGRPRQAKSYWPIRSLPRHDSNEYTFMVLTTPCAAERALAAIAVAQRAFESRNYTVIEGHRAGAPMITSRGHRMTLVDALKAAGAKVKYLTAYRRLERGWSIEQALGLSPPAPRWDTGKQAERRARARTPRAPASPA